MFEQLLTAGLFLALIYGLVFTRISAAWVFSLTMLACYLVEQGMEAGKALARVRRERPGSVETAGQEETVRGYAAHRRSLAVRPA